jgi:hypothetical protein
MAEKQGTETTIVMAGEQLRSAVDMAGLKSVLASYTDRERCMRYVSAWRETANASWDLSEGGVSHEQTVAVADAVDLIYQMRERILKVGVDTCDPMLWLQLRELVVAAIRVSLYNNVAFSDDGMTADDALRLCSVYLDICLRAADDDLRVTSAPVADEREMLGRAASIYVDLLCGRAAAWMRLVEVNGRLCFAAKGLDWDATIDAMAWDHTLNVIDNLRGLYHADGEELDDEAASERWSALLYSMAAAYDAISCVTCGLDVEPLDLSVVAHKDIVDATSEAGVDLLARTYPSFAGSIGVCEAFGVPSVFCVATLPEAIRDNIVEGIGDAPYQEYVQSLVA